MIIFEYIGYLKLMIILDGDTEVMDTPWVYAQE